MCYSGGGSTVGTAFGSNVVSGFYEAQLMRPKPVKANRTLTPLETAELLDALLGAGVLEVLKDEVEPGAVGGGQSDTPCGESGEIYKKCG